jgi:hypothetical protein
VKAVSRDGRAFVPLRDVPEIQTVLGAPPRKDDVVKAQGEATRQIREWLASVRERPSHEVFRVPVTASRDAYRAAFFSLVHRYVPTRLPPEATAELRLACEEAFLHLSERMVDLERHFRSQRASAPPAQPAVSAAPAAAPQPAKVSWRGGMIHTRLTLARGDARVFVADPEFNWNNDCLFVFSGERVMVGTPAEVTMIFEGHVTQIHGAGRIVGVKPGVGFGVKLLDMSEDQRSMIRTWVARA